MNGRSGFELRLVTLCHPYFTRVTTGADLSLIRHMGKIFTAMIEMAWISR